MHLGLSFQAHIEKNSINPTCAGLSLGADFEHTLHVFLSFWVWQNEMLQLNFEMLNLTNAAIHYYIGLLHHESFFKMVENIFLITVGFKTKKVLVSLFRSCRCDFLQTKWNNFRWCFTQLFPNFSLETAISQFRFSSSREGMKSQKETKKALFWWRMVGQQMFWGSHVSFSTKAQLMQIWESRSWFQRNLESPQGTKDWHEWALKHQWPLVAKEVHVIKIIT